jgi:hypothetical protein
MTMTPLDEEFKEWCQRIDTRLNRIRLNQNDLAERLKNFDSVIDTEKNLNSEEETPSTEKEDA